MADIREDFEKYIEEAGMGVGLSRDGDSYYSREVHNLWCCYRAALASRPAEVDEAWVLLFEALPHISPHAVNPAIARVGPIEDAYINTRIRKYLERVAAPSHTTNKEK